MRMTEQALPALSGGRRIRTVWFHTWQYSQFGAHEALPASLLNTLVYCLGPEPALAEKVKRSLAGLMRPMLATTVRATTLGAV